MLTPRTPDEVIEPVIRCMDRGYWSALARGVREPVSEAVSYACGVYSLDSSDEKLRENLAEAWRRWDRQATIDQEVSA